MCKLTLKCHVSIPSSPSSWTQTTQSRNSTNASVKTSTRRCTCLCNLRWAFILLRKLLNCVPQSRNTQSDATFLRVHWYVHAQCVEGLVACYICPNLTLFIWLGGWNPPADVIHSCFYFEVDISGNERSQMKWRDLKVLISLDDKTC